MAKAIKEPEARRIMPKVKEDLSQPTYKAICHTPCFWQNTLWAEGDIYMGAAKPPKHFSKDGVNPKVDPAVRTAGDDPRSNVEMLSILKTRFGVEPPLDEFGRQPTRTVIYEMLRAHEKTAAGGGGIKTKK